ncbi:TolC family protein [Parasphingopyxis lamellibrachiae]|uniref:Cobalt-zinc-cadmium efflux system outer membrane protein n=1 Tax=Parasphingopyxis lamellibrachiae TaxID=680125 RepID=A0A3D9FGB3_9SPHN|nr:TolC family protein [Parasphingopyxis lamellibrachiae]RED16688.1 cobalt-zinc-cadmium efflux system outer membrane protein [Parasphingopyxis lamellibrachiae]
MSVIRACQRPLLGALLAIVVAPAASAQDESLTLSQALELAGASPSVDVAEAQVDIARGNQEQAGLRPNPEISLEIENVVGTGPFRDFRSTETTLAIGQRLELGGKRSTRVEAARAETSVAAIRAEIARADLILSVRQRFVDAVAARQRLRLAEQALERSRELARIASVLVDVGRDPPLRGLRAEANLGEAEAELAERRAEDENARRSLAALWGDPMPPAQVDETSISLDRRSVPVEPLSLLAIRLADAEVFAAQAIIDRERSLRTPDLTLSAGIRRNEEADARGFVAGASFTLPFGNRNQGAIAAAQAAARVSEAQRSLLVVESVRGIASARATLAAADERVETLENRTVPQAEEALRLADIGYRAGRFSLIELLDATEARDAALNALIDAREARDTATAVLARVTAQ